MSLRALRECDEDEYVSLEGKQSLMAGIGIEREGEESNVDEKYIYPFSIHNEMHRQSCPLLG